MSNQRRPSQHDANCLAVFIEAVDELKREPFFSPDDKPNISIQGNVKKADFGDRTHFRSALITFRRMWMEKEASFFPYICNLIKRFESEPAIRFIDNTIMVHYKHYIDVRFLGIPLSGKEIVDLWLNGVFAHTNIKNPAGRPGRIQFEEAVKKYGATHLEFICRTTIKSAGFCYFNLLTLAKRTLKRWDEDYGIKPHFEISAPFGKAQVESNDDGFIVTRKPSTEHSANETEEQKAGRFLRRDEFQTLAKVVKALDLGADIFLASLKVSTSYEGFLQSAGYRLEIKENVTAQDFVSEMGQHGVIAIIPDHYYSIQSNLLTVVHSNRSVITNSFTIQHFNQQFADLRVQIAA
jgi:hypothetical protein